MRILKVNDRVRKVVADTDADNWIAPVIATLPPELDKSVARAVESHLKALWHGLNTVHPVTWLKGFGRFLKVAELPLFCRASSELRNLISDMVRRFSTMAMQDDDLGLEGNQKAYRISEIIAEIGLLLKDSSISEMPGVAEVFKDIIARLKGMVPEGMSKIMMTLLSKARALIPPRIRPNIYADDIFACLAKMVPPGADPLHAMMYLQKKVKTVKDLVDDTFSPEPPGRETYRFWLSKGIEKYIDFRLPNKTPSPFAPPVIPALLFRTGIYEETAIVSAPGLESLRIELKGHRRWADPESRVSLPDGAGTAWWNAFTAGTVIVHLEKWNLDLDRD